MVQAGSHTARNAPAHLQGVPLQAAFVRQDLISVADVERPSGLSQRPKDDPDNFHP